MAKAPSALVILDGFGFRAEHDNNAIYHAHPKNFMNWLENYPSALLKAYGTHVGLLRSMIGNSEVGHLTIGTGRVIKQAVVVFHEMINSGALFSNRLLIKRFREIKDAGGTLHIMGLLSDAGVHSHEYHLYGFLTLAAAQGLTNIKVHAFLDGRDVPPKSAALYLKRLDNILTNLGVGTIGSLHGRFYAMDRDHNWDRTRKSYETLTSKSQPIFSNWQDALEKSYEQNITDEFFVPVGLDQDATIKNNDGILFFNFRADRARQLTEALLDHNFHAFQAKHLALTCMITATQYSHHFKTDVLYYRPHIDDTFFDILEAHKKQIFTIAETEKYAHVTYFFNGGHEKIRPNETRILVPSVGSHEHTYAHYPRMSADEITRTVLTSLYQQPRDFYLINYANADMVGHSGDFSATCKAISCLDEQLGKLYDVLVKQLKGTLYITGDHGKAEEMWNTKFDQPRTAHTSNPVYFLRVAHANELPKKLPLSQLSDIAPFILRELDLPIPKIMLEVPI